MQVIEVVVSGLSEARDGMILGTSVNFKVYQGDMAIITESLTGKATAPYRRQYTVADGDGELRVEHDRHDLPHLKIFACLVHPLCGNCPHRLS